MHNRNSKLIGSAEEYKALVQKYLSWIENGLADDFKSICYSLEYRKLQNLKPVEDHIRKLEVNDNDFLVDQILTVADLSVFSCV